MKDGKIRILCVIVAALSLFSVIPIMFGFYRYELNGFYTTEYGFELYSNKNQWWFILIGVLGLVSLLWNLVYGAYAIIDGRYKNLTWKIARYGYFYGIVIGMINFAAIISNCTYAVLATWFFLVLIAAVVALEVVLIILKDEDTKLKNPQ